MLAAACLDPDAPFTIADVYRDLDSPDINVRELGAYTLRASIPRSGADRAEISRTAVRKRRPYPGRSALGDLLVNLALQEHPSATKVDNKDFWDPIWDHTRLDVWDIRAAVPFMAAGRPVKGALRGADSDVRATYRYFQQTEELRQELERTEDNLKLRRLVGKFYKLGADPDEIGLAEEELKASPRLEKFVRLFFFHPLWNVGETAASVLTSIVENETDDQNQDAAKAIVSELLFGGTGTTYWRIRYGAIEAAYQLIAFDHMELFGKAVNEFYKCRNSRIRALCAEDLIANILDIGHHGCGPRSLTRFKTAITWWIGDKDCWVLEHVFRLLTNLEAEGTDPGFLFPKRMPPLLEGLPKSGWANLPRATFLTHIEARKRAQLGR